MIAPFKPKDGHEAKDIKVGESQKSVYLSRYLCEGVKQMSLSPWLVLCCIVVVVVGCVSVGTGQDQPSVVSYCQS